MRVFGSVRRGGGRLLGGRLFGGRLLGGMVTGGVLCIGVFVSSASAGSPAPTLPDDPVRSGDAVVVAPANTGDELVAGGSGTVFTLRLPEGSECPGDSRHDQYRTQSFLVPAGTDLGEIAYGVNDPVGDNSWSLYKATDTSPYVDEGLPPNQGPGQPARIDPLPPFSFAEFPPGLLPDGEYTIGIACTYFRDTSNWWDVTIVIENDAADSPAQLTWRVAGVSTEVAEEAITDAADSGSNTLAIVGLTASVLVLVVLGAFAVRKRLNPDPQGAS